MSIHPIVTFSVVYAQLNYFSDSILLFDASRFTGVRENWIQTAAKYPYGTYLNVDIELGRNQNNLGTVCIESTNAFNTPLIEVKHFQNENGPVEVKRFIQHIRFLRQVLFNGSFAKHVEYEDLPGYYSIVPIFIVVEKIAHDKLQLTRRTSFLTIFARIGMYSSKNNYIHKEIKNRPLHPRQDLSKKYPFVV